MTKTSDNTITGEIVKVVVPSFKRANNVLTTKNVANCALVVPERQVADYEKHNPGIEVIGHPDDCYGINQARQWIYDNYPNVMMLDDDINNVSVMLEPPLYERAAYPDSRATDKLTPQEAYDAIQSLAFLAKQMGCYLFGFTSAVNPRDVRPQSPFTINGYVKGTTMGMLEGSKLHFPMEEAGRTCEDHYVTLLNAYHHRYGIVDNRFTFRHTGTFKTVGGCSDYRTSDSEQYAYRLLRKKFGNAVQLKGQGITNDGKVRKTSHQYERVISIPY